MEVFFGVGFDSGEIPLSWDDKEEEEKEEKEEKEEEEEEEETIGFIDGDSCWDEEGDVLFCSDIQIETTGK